MEGTTTIKVDNGELYVRGDTIVGRKVIDGNFTYYYRGDLLHNENGPAVICMQNGVAVAEQYMIAGVPHNESGPAVIRRYNSGTIRRELYAIHGKIHRADAPAFICYNTTGNIITSEYWVDGIYKSIKNNGNTFGELAALKKELEAARNSLAQAELAVGGMREEHDEARDKLAAVLTERDDLRTALETTQTELEKARKCIDDQVSAAKILVNMIGENEDAKCKFRDELFALKQKIRTIIDE